MYDKIVGSMPYLLFYSPITTMPTKTTKEQHTCGYQ